MIRSFITAMKSFPMNIEVIQTFTYNATKPPVLEDTETISIHEPIDDFTT
jgi:hypothetical protein